MRVLLTRSLIGTVLLAALLGQDSSAYRTVLERFVRGPGVDYAALKAQRADLDAAVRSFGEVTASQELGWPWCGADRVLDERV